MISVAGAGPAFFPPVDRPIPIRSDSFDLPSAVCSSKKQDRIGMSAQNRRREGRRKEKDGPETARGEGG